MKALLGSPWVRGGLILGIATFVVLFGIRLGWMYVLGDLAGESYAHPAPGVWRWQPWIHPPLYGEYMRLLEAISDRFWLGEELVAFWAGGVFAACVTVAGAAWARTTLGPGWDVAAAVLLGFTASNLRPFENYPPGRALIFVGVWLLFVLHRGGATRWRWVATVAVLWAATELHLSSWFVLGPLWFFLAAADGRATARTKAHVRGIAAWLVAFGLSTWPGLFRVLGEGPGDGRLGDGSVQWSHITLEWTDVGLFLPLLLWAIPAVRAGRGPWVAASLAIAVYTAITWWLMAHNLAIGGPKVASHHYFELVDPLLAMTALAATHAAWTTSVGPRRIAIGLGGGILLVLHVWGYADAFQTLQEMAAGWTR